MLAHTGLPAMLCTVSEADVLVAVFLERAEQAEQKSLYVEILHIKLK